jgi:hypothetical protein
MQQAMRLALNPDGTLTVVPDTRTDAERQAQRAERTKAVKAHLRTAHGIVVSGAVAYRVGK